MVVRVHGWVPVMVTPSGGPVGLMDGVAGGSGVLAGRLQAELLLALDLYDLSVVHGNLHRTETQIARVIARNGLPREAVQAIISAQATRAARLAAADWVLYNDEAMTIEALRACTDRISAWFGL